VATGVQLLPGIDLSVDAMLDASLVLRSDTRCAAGVFDAEDEIK
jgi:hypothetical protein